MSFLIILGMTVALFVGGAVLCAPFLLAVHYLGIVPGLLVAVLTVAFATWLLCEPFESCRMEDDKRECVCKVEEDV
jgi:hypothetical protein